MTNQPSKPSEPIKPNQTRKLLGAGAGAAGQSALARWAAPLLTIALLAGAAQSVQSRRPAEAADYFKRVRAAAGELPRVIGDWYAREVPVPAPALKILQPNFLISRQYQNLRTSRAVTILIVQSLDAYDMVYHYPPNCFKHNGWTKEWQQQRHWQAGETSFDLMEYGFHRSKFTGDEDIIVANFIVLATGFALDMKAIETAARDPSQRPFGAAQVQLVFDASIPEQDRKQAFDEIIRDHQPLFREMLDPSTKTPLPLREGQGEGRALSRN